VEDYAQHISGLYQGDDDHVLTVIKSVAKIYLHTKFDSNIFIADLAGKCLFTPLLGRFGT